MSFNFLPATQEYALPLQIYREGGAYCRLSHLHYGTTNTVIKKMCRLDVPARLAERGQQLLNKLDALLQSLDAPSWLKSAGHPSWSFLLISDSANHSSWLLKSYFIQELCKRGILSLGSHNINLAHGEAEAYAEVLI